MKKILSLTALLLTLTLLSGCIPLPTPPETTQPETGETESPTQAPTTEPTEAPTEPDPLVLQLESMTLEEKVGQLFMVTPGTLGLPQIKAPMDAITQEQVTQMEAAIREIFEKYPVGGIVQFAADLYSPEQITAYNALLQKAAKIPLFLGIDEEGGTVARLANHSGFDLPQYQSAGAVGASGNPKDALKMGQTIGAYLQEYGFNMDFAPVADVNTNPNNPVIGNRSFSSDCNMASRMAKAMAQGLEEKGIVPVFKHFPGHGDTAQDSHDEVAYSVKTLEELQGCEFIPFSGLTENQCVMVGHIALPEVTGNMTPATLSSQIVTGLLREELGFRGLIFTDSMVMEAITDNYSGAEASLLALTAGCQVILQPEDFPSAFTGVVEAVKAGTFPEEQLDTVVLQILRFKEAVIGYHP